MKAQIIIIGDEILNGRIQDQNIHPLIRWLDQMGFDCEQITVMQDQEENLLEVLQQAWKRVNLVITTGGIGPTRDDITKTTLARLTQSKLVENEKAKELVQRLYERQGKTWNRELNHYHIIPEKVDIFDNPKGYAPGLMIKEDNDDRTKAKLLLAAPGVPRELRAMINETFPQILQDVFPELDQSPKVVSIRTFGIPEEKIFGEVCPDLWNQLEAFGKVSSLPQRIGVDIHIKMSDSKQFSLHKEEIIHIFKSSKLSENIWSYEFIELEEAVIQKAMEKKLTLGLAESCTGGLVANMLTNIPGSSSVFLGGIVSYANEVKIKSLGVSSETIEKWGAVSEQTALEMATGAQKKLEVDIALSLTGIAGPGGGTEDKPVGTVCIGLATQKDQFYKRFQFSGDRLLLKERFAQMALLQTLKVIDSF